MSGERWVSVKAIKTWLLSWAISVIYFNLLWLFTGYGPCMLLSKNFCNNWLALVYTTGLVVVFAMEVGGLVAVFGVFVVLTLLPEGGACASRAIRVCGMASWWTICSICAWKWSSFSWISSLAKKITHFFSCVFLSVRVSWISLWLVFFYIFCSLFCSLNVSKVAPHFATCSFIQGLVAHPWVVVWALTAFVAAFCSV